jgi:hypothetical protein
MYRDHNTFAFGGSFSTDMTYDLGVINPGHVFIDTVRIVQVQYRLYCVTCTGTSFTKARKVSKFYTHILYRIRKSNTSTSTRKNVKRNNKQQHCNRTDFDFVRQAFSFKGELDSWYYIFLNSFELVIRSFTGVLDNEEKQINKQYIFFGLYIQTKV